MTRTYRFILFPPDQPPPPDARPSASDEDTTEEIAYLCRTRGMHARIFFSDGSYRDRRLT